MVFLSTVLLASLGWLFIAVTHYSLGKNLSWDTQKRLLRRQVVVTILIALVPLFMVKFLLWSAPWSTGLRAGETWKCEFVHSDGRTIPGTLVFNEVGRYTDVTTGKIYVTHEGFALPGASGTYQYGTERGAFSASIDDDGLLSGKYIAQGKRVPGELFFCFSCKDIREKLKNGDAVRIRVYKDSMFVY